MGYYVNPQGESKEAFLNRVGTKVDQPVAWGDIPDGVLPVILVDNGMFTAAAVGYKEAEYKHFLDPTDPRRRKIYHVKVDDLLPVVGGLAGAIGAEA